MFYFYLIIALPINLFIAIHSMWIYVKTEDIHQLLAFVVNMTCVIIWVLNIERIYLHRQMKRYLDECDRLRHQIDAKRNGHAEKINQ